jgi:hypothetical protein
MEADLMDRTGLVAVATIRSGRLGLVVVAIIRLVLMAAVDNRMVPVVVGITHLVPEAAEVNRMGLAVVDTILLVPVTAEADTTLQDLVVVVSKVEEAIAFTLAVVATSLKVALQTAVAPAASTVVAVARMGSAGVVSVPI